MPRTNDRDATIESLLERAAVLRREYDDYDPVAAREAIVRRQGRPRPAIGRAAPARCPSEHEQARHELDLAATLVVNAPQAAACLARQADGGRIDPDGALVFGCLLHLTGRAEAAEFWWRFGARGGSHTAAYCLYLGHRSHGEFRDAEHWRERAARLAATADRPEPAGQAARREHPDESPLLPPDVTHDLLSQCHQGLAPHLPDALEHVIDRLRVERDDAALAEIPQPCPALVQRLADGAP